MNNLPNAYQIRVNAVISYILFVYRKFEWASWLAGCLHRITDMVEFSGYEVEFYTLLQPCNAYFDSTLSS